MGVHVLYTNGLKTGWYGGFILYHLQFPRVSLFFVQASKFREPPISKIPRGLQFHGSSFFYAQETCKRKAGVKGEAEALRAISSGQTSMTLRAMKKVIRFHGFMVFHIFFVQAAIRNSST